MNDYRDLLNVPFKLHGRSKEEGFDCLGLAIEILKRDGITLPDMNYDCLSETKYLEKFYSDVGCFTKIEKPRINCIIEIEYKGLPQHIAVYIGDGKMIHSVIDKGVRIEPLHLWINRIKGYYSVTNNNI